MKKLFISLVALTAAVAVNATITSISQLRLTSTTNNYGEVILAVDDAASAEIAGSPINMTGKSIAIYAIGAQNLATASATALEEVQLGIKTDAGTSFKIKAMIVNGEALVLRDLVEGVNVTLAAGEEYEFTAAANSTINDRFIINPAAPAEPQICHEGQLLKVTNYNGIVKVDDNEYDVAGNLDIDIANLSAGHHTVNFDGQDLIINVR